MRRRSGLAFGRIGLAAFGSAPANGAGECDGGQVGPETWDIVIEGHVRAWEEIKMSISKVLSGAAVALIIAMPATAQAQCSYRMNDVGRSHGYLSGPCNGAAQGYSGAYPSRRATWYRRDGSISPTNPNLRTVRNGNSVAVYDQGGRLLRYGTKRGNVLKLYNASGRHMSTGVFGRNGTAIYDTRGRLVSSTPDIRR